MARRTKAAAAGADDPVTSEPAVEEVPAAEAVVIDTVSPDPLVPPPAPAPSRGKATGLFVAGVGAAIAGAVAAVFVLNARPDLLGVADNSGALEARIAELESRVRENREAMEAMSQAARQASDPRVDDIGATVSGLDQAIRSLATRLEQLETAAPSGAVSGEAVAAAQAASEAANVARQQAEALQAEAADIARKGRVSVALADLAGAIDRGASLQPALEVIAADGMSVPEALAANAQGVPTLAALRSAFPPAARDALAASLPGATGEAPWDRFTAFLRGQAGVRSLTPQAGDDPDAILSRAEAALALDDLPAALAEIAALPDAGRERMSEWVGLAERRQQAVEGLTALRAEAGQ